MQEGEEDEVGAGALELHDALGDLRGRSDQVGAETVVILDEVLETGLGPIALTFRRGFAGVLHLVAEGVYGLGVSLLDDFVENLAGFGFRLARNHEGVDANPDAMPILGRLHSDIIDLLLDFFGRIAICKVPIRDPRRHIPGRSRRAALEDFGLRIARLGFEGVIAEAVEIPAEREIVFAPDAAQRPNELLGPAISLIMIEPGLADCCEFTTKPAADNIHRDTTV